MSEVVCLACVCFSLGFNVALFILDDEKTFSNCHKEGYYNKQIDINKVNTKSKEFKCEMVRRKIIGEDER